jgi:hypothetical protein
VVVGGAFLAQGRLGLMLRKPWGLDATGIALGSVQVLYRSCSSGVQPPWEVPDDEYDKTFLHGRRLGQRPGAAVRRRRPAAPGQGHSHARLRRGSAACGASLVAGVVSLWGVRANGPLAILPAAVLGILLSLAVGALAVMFLALTGLPVP